jgi:hypothetical protein
MTITSADVTLRKGPWYIGYAPVGKIATLVYDFDHDRYFRNQTIVSINDVLTTTRASEASYYDSNGVIHFVDANTPRINYNPSTGSCLGLMIEDSSKNYFIRTEDFNSAYWTKQNSVSITQDATQSPNHGVSADLISWGSNGSSIYQVVTTDATATDITITIYAKPNSNDGLSILLYNWVTFGNIKVLVVNDITTGEAVGNGFYRHTLSATISDGIGWTPGDDVNVYIYPDNNYGYVTSSSYYIWGVQFEQRSSPTSYIRQLSGSKMSNRPAEIHEHVLDSEYVGGGTFMCEYDSNNQFDTIFEFYASTTNTLKVQGGIITYTGNNLSTTGTYSNSTINRFSIQFSEDGSLSYSYNGSLPTTKSGSAMTSSPSTLRIGSTQTNGNRLNGHVRKIMYYPRQANDNRLVRLTNGT